MLSCTAKRRLAIICAAGLAVLSLSFDQARAVPSFGRQTGLSCTACHTVWPELNHFGRTYKMHAYTFSTKSSSGARSVPVAGSILASYTALDESRHVLTDGAAPFDNPDHSATDRFNLPQEAVIFFAGSLVSDLGVFAHFTYDGTANQIALDHAEVRYARAFIAGGKHLVLGATLNNAPSIEDAWSTTPVWGCPFASSAVAPAPSAVTLIDGTLSEQVGGIGAYASWANLIYGAVSIYRTTYDNVTRPLGAGNGPVIVTKGAVPYWRAALHHTWKKHSAEAGAYGLAADVFPAGADRGPSDSFRDFAFDAQYQFVSNPQVFGARATWIHESQDWDASRPLGRASNPSDVLETLRVNADYFYRSSHGAFGWYLAYFATTGDTDPSLYEPSPVGGSETGRPDSRGVIAQGTWVAKEKYQFSVQYTMYSKFNGADVNYDGFGRDASDNNTLYLFAWLTF